MVDSLLNLPGGLFSEFERLRRELDDAFDAGGMPSSIRSVAPGTFPALNVGHTPTSVEIYAFAPGLDAAKVDVTVDRGVLTLAGERLPSAESEGGRDATGGRRISIYSRERPTGRFRRAVSLPEDADPARVEARYRDGVLHVSVARREAPKPTRVAVQ